MTAEVSNLFHRKAHLFISWTVGRSGVSRGKGQKIDGAAFVIAGLVLMLLTVLKTFYISCLLLSQLFFHLFL